MGKRSAERDSFEGNKSSIRREDTAFYAKRRLQFSSRWDGGTISTNLEGIWARRISRMSSARALLTLQPSAGTTQPRQKKAFAPHARSAPT